MRSSILIFMQSHLQHVTVTTVAAEATSPTNTTWLVRGTIEHINKLIHTATLLAKTSHWHGQEKIEISVMPDAENEQKERLVVVLYIDVNKINDSPMLQVTTDVDVGGTISSTNIVTALEDEWVVMSAAALVSDPDVNDQLRLNVRPMGDGTVQVPAPLVGIQWIEQTPYSIIIEGSALRLQTALRTFEYRGDAHAHGNYSISITVSDPKGLTVSILSERERASRNGSTVVDISMTSPSFKPISLSLSRISSILKHPNKSFFNPIKYI